MNLYQQIMEAVPQLTNADFREYVTLRDDSDGRGPYIARWEHPTIPRPDVCVELSEAKAKERIVEQEAKRVADAAIAAERAAKLAEAEARRKAEFDAAVNAEIERRAGV